MAKTKQPSDDVPFEGLLEKLDALVTTLEKGELSLEDSLTAYEDGVRLVRHANARLDQMDKRLLQLLADGTLAPLDVKDEVANHHGEETES